jgi:large subunit ribosomal protein L30
VIDAEKELAKLAASAGAGRPAAKKRSAAGKSAEAGKSASGITVRLVKSGICTPKDHKATLRGLGLRRLGQRVVRPDTPAVRGMVHKVRHLVEIEAEKN